MHLLFILHASFEGPGIVESWALAKGFQASCCSPFSGEKLPEWDRFNLIVSMGGPQSAALDQEKYPYLKEEIDFLRGALKAKVPVLGFCLGAQLIGEALGAHTERSPFKEIGVYPITLTKDGEDDPLLRGLPTTLLVPHWHGDMPGLTKECSVLAKSQGCPRQIIRYLPHAYGFQCHPEITEEVVKALIENCAEDFTKDTYVQTPEEILSHNFHTLNHDRMFNILNRFPLLTSSSYEHLNGP